MKNISREYIQCNTSAYTELLFLDQNERDILACVAAVVMILGLSSCSLVLYALLKSKLFTNHSMKLVAVLLLSDLSFSVIAMPLIIRSLLGSYSCDIISAGIPDRFCLLEISR